MEFSLDDEELPLKEIEEIFSLSAYEVESLMELEVGETFVVEDYLREEHIIRRES